LGLALLVGAAVFFLLYRPAFVVTAIRAAEPVVSGADVTVSVLVGNTGWGAGEHEVTLLVDQEPAASATVTVQGGAESWVDVVLRGLDAGRYTVTVDDVDDLDAAVWVMTPPEFVIDSITLAPNTLDLNTSTETTLLVRLSNIGEADGEHDLELIVDGVAAESRHVALSGGAFGEEVFGIAVATPGPHEVRVGDAVATLRVNQLARPGNGAVLVNSIGGGANELRIFNNDPDDLLVVLTAPGPGQPALLSVYVHANSSYTVKRLADGVYSTYYAFGADWCGYHSEFTRNASYGQFEQDSAYESGRTFYTYYTLEMGGTGGGWAPTASLPVDSFPGM
jgi:hypothetical protein